MGTPIAVNCSFKRRTSLLLASLLLIADFLFPQITTSGVPFLLITTSVETNSMGGLSFGIPSADPNMFFRNAGLLGFNSLRTVGGTSFYTSKTAWLPMFHIEDLNLNSYSAFVTSKIGQFLSSPVPLALGISYNRFRVNLGRFNITQGSPEPIATFDAWEDASTFSVGVGTEMFVRLGLGYGWTNVRSNLLPYWLLPPVSTVEVPATRWGVFVQVPFMDLFSDEMGNFSPVLDLSFGYAKNNIGTSIRYIDTTQSDPLPRQLGLGYSLTVGTDLNSTEGHWPVIRATFGHDAEDLLITRNPSGTWSYSSGLNDIVLVDNVLLGKSNPKIVQRTGWEVEILGMFSYRKGRWDGEGFSIIQTEGFGINFNASFQLLHGMWQNEIVEFLADHVVVTFNQSEYRQMPGYPLDGTSFHGIVIWIK